MLHTTVVPTPPGPLAIVLDDEGVVVASGFTDVDDQLGRLPDALKADGVADDAAGSAAARAVRAYVDGAQALVNGELRALAQAVRQLPPLLGRRPAGPA